MSVSLSLSFSIDLSWTGNYASNGSNIFQIRLKRFGFCADGCSITDSLFFIICSIANFSMQVMKKQ